MEFPANVYLASALLAALSAAASISFWRQWCRKHGLVDDPGHRKIHTEPTPLAGGLAVLTGLVVPLLAGIILSCAHPATRDFLVSHLDHFIDMADVGLFQYGLGKRCLQLAGIIVGAIGMLAVGLRDDQVELGPGVKFLTQFVFAFIVAAVGVRATVFIHSLAFSYFVTILWILTVVNAFNFIDNMNGLCGGVGAIAATTFAAIAAHRGQYLVAATAFLIAGALLGFLPFNYPKASTFLGDAGSHLVGYLLAILAILPHFYTPKHQTHLAVFTPILVLAVPLADLAWVVCLRWCMGKPIYIGDTNHLSHQLQRRGLGKPLAVAIIWSMALAAGVLAFALQ